MYPISSTVKALFEAEQRQILRITGTDKNGASINITDADIMQDSFSIDRFSCNGSKIEVGTAIASELEFKLNNTDGRFNNIVFEGAELFVEIGIADWTQDNPTINWIPCGYYIPDQQPRRLDIITIKAMDRMQLLDRTQPALAKWTTNTGAVITDNNSNEIDFNAYVGFPNTVQGIINTVCEFCGITLGQNVGSLPNATYNLAYMPKMQQQVTFRNLIQWCAGIMGTNAWFDWNGYLRFSWYDNTTDYESTTANRYKSDYHENDLTITGVQYTNAQNVVIVSGSAVYALDLKDNLLVAPFIAEVLPVLRNALMGYTYRPFTASAINAPYLWPMDVVTFTDKDGIEYESALTNVNFGINGTTWLESVGETEQTNKNTAPTQLSPEQAQLINEAINSTQELSESLDQEGVFNRLTNGGEAQGIYLQDGKLYINGSYMRIGMITDGTGANYWNLNTGDFMLSPGANLGDKTVTQINDGITNAQSTANSAQNAVNTLDNSLNQQGVFNRLTNNGAAQGIYMQNGQLYINMSYARAGTLVLGGLNNQNGLLQVLNANGTEIGTWNNNGLSATGQFTSKSSNGQYVVDVLDGEIRLLNNNAVAGKIQWSPATIRRPNATVFSGDTVAMETNDAYIIANGRNISIGSETEVYLNSYTIHLGSTVLKVTKFDSSGSIIDSQNGYTGELRFNDGDGIAHAVYFLNGIVYSVS